jgi:hypothetical protein
MMDRWDDRASQIMKINNSSATKDTMAPKDETTFHFINASG